MRTTTRSDYRERIVAVVAYLADRLDDVPDLATLAAVGGFSPFWFHRIFVAAVGETPAEVSRRMRLERAAWRLQTTDRTVAELAHEAGFSDQPAFTRAFRNAYGAPPGRFRAEGLPAHEIPSRTEIHFSPHGTPYRIWLPDLEPNAMNFETIPLESRPYVYLRHQGPYPEIGATFGKLAAVVGAAGLVGPGALFVGVYYDDPGTTAPEDLRSDAGLIVAPGARTPERLEQGDLPGGLHAKAIHKGSFDRMSESWGAFMNALQSSGAKLRMAPPFEVYVSDMETTPVDELITELYVPLEGES